MLTTSSQPSDYLPLALRCRSKNEFNRLHIAFENILAPTEFTYFMDLVATQQLPKLTYEWLRKVAELSPGLYDSPQGFRREALAENVLLYRDPTENHGGKTLLIGFAGNSRRLMMPIAIFLQCFDSRRWDVLLLRKGLEQRSFFEGVQGAAANFSELLGYVRKAAPTEKYCGVVTYGTSGGGLAAILAAVLLGITRGVAVGGTPPSSPLEPWLKAELAERGANGLPAPQLHYIYGAGNESDRQSALALQNLFGGRLHQIDGVHHHNPLKPMLKAGQLKTFLNELLA